MEYKTLFPEFESYDFGHLKVDDVHEIYYEQSGNPNGAPVVFVHGGPGCGCGDKSKRFLDPSFYRIVTIDQRGCGKSKPFLELKDNNTQNLAKDMEKIREHLKIDKWLVYGGSWGTTLSLYYAENYPQSVVGLKEFSWEEMKILSGCIKAEQECSSLKLLKSLNLLLMKKKEKIMFKVITNT